MRSNIINKTTCVALLFSFALMSILTICNSNTQADEGLHEGIKVPIIMYHQVKPFNTGKDVITPGEIESDLKYLTDNHFNTITMTDLVHYVYDGKELPEKPIILTFDDGYYNNYVYVYPLIKKYNVKIVISLVGKSTDDFSNIPDVNVDYSHLTWDQVNEMLSSGLVEFQNHTYHLHNITRNRYGCNKNSGESQEHYEKVLREDIGKLQDEITDMTGITPNTFNYPYGKTCSDSNGIIKKLGFKASLTCDYGVNFITRNPDDLFGLKRICRAHGVSVKKLLQDTKML